MMYVAQLLPSADEARILRDILMAVYLDESSHGQPIRDVAAKYALKLSEALVKAGEP